MPALFCSENMLDRNLSLRLQDSRIGIDTRAVYEGPLTAAILDPAIDSSVAPRFLQIPYA